ncbi:TIGR03087 family PEP-CTERM/XrtA system glycosyltransferase [Sphingomonas oligophenolica]|uniref:TIGR03087 family PEP-CTERM/XrtA system glycosyltransferase n=1 Tax=Sphingomonas oligophenolica TaxID=301154 RepID=A0A502CHC0_9SPHN|nr:TIGR03087 family PEP-CTERM/XrtA system glycosyltransferase [Sphingomonas oligophenolica]TPG12368.1 TIGR03087 family PEP-CTERM/XrtA system glycosyltransferase [Sphingomonas oligophenolica]
MNILFLAHRAPFPPDRGDKIRSYHVLRHLAARARVHLIGFAEDPADRHIPDDLRARLTSVTIVPRTKSRGLAAIEAVLTGQPVSLTAFADHAMARAVRRVLDGEPIEAIYCFSGQMAQYLPIDGPRAIMDFVDVDSAKFGGFATRGPLALRWLMRREARLLGAFERDVARRVDVSLLVSDAEAELFRDGGAEGDVRVVENGIDAGVFDPTIVTPVDEAGPLIVFTGQMDYRPNIDAVTWFARSVMPLIRQQHRDARFAIVGRAPSAAVKALAGPGVIVTGAVDDVRGWIAAASVCVAPLELARGIQNKILEAMAMARAVVASAVAAEGIDHGGTIQVADGATDTAAAVIALIDDRDTAAALGEAARVRVLARYDWDARLAPLDRLLGLDT